MYSPQVNPLMLMALASMSRPLGLPPGGGGASQGAANSMGGSTSPLAEMGGGFSRGNQFSPMDLSQGGGLPNWMLDPNLPPGMDWGPSWEGGDSQPMQLTLAENAGLIGRTAGTLSGLPFGSTVGRLLANALANQYYNSHVLANPAPPQPGPLDNIAQNDAFLNEARQNSSQGFNNPNYQQYSDPRRNNMPGFYNIWGK